MMAKSYGKSKKTQSANRQRNITPLQDSHPREPDRQQHRTGRSPRPDARPHHRSLRRGRGHALFA